MVKDVLILTYDTESAGRLVSGLKAADVNQINLASSTRELFRYLENSSLELAIIPARDAQHRIHSLHSIRPDLSIVLLLDADTSQVPRSLDKAILGVLHPSYLESEIPLVLSRAEYRKTKKPPQEVDKLQAICAEIDLDDGVKNVILSKGTQVRSCSDTKDPKLIQTMVERVGRSWDNGKRTAQIQYVKVASSSETILLYTRPYGDALLTIVASSGTSIGAIRGQADAIAVNLAAIASPPAIETEIEDEAQAEVQADTPPEVPASLVLDQTTLVQDAAIGTIALDIPKETRGETTLKGAAGSEFYSRFTAVAGALWFLFRRLAFGLIVLLAIIFLTYFGLNMARGSSASEAVVEAIPDSIAYIEGVLQGDLGLTTADPNSMLAVPVSQLIRERLPRSLALLGLSLLLASIIGIPLGIRAARRGSKESLGIIITTIIGVSVPSFFIAFLLQWGITSLTRQTGVRVLPVGGFGWDAHLILPVIVLAARPLAQITRITYTSVSNVFGQDYVRTALSKGLRNVHVMGRHVMRNAAIPILTTIGISLSFALSSLPVVELYFGWPGIGATLIGSIARQDDDLTVSLLLCLGIIFILVNILLETSYRFIDPRTRETPAHLIQRRRHTPFVILKEWGTDIGDYLTDNALTQWFQRRFTRGEATPQNEASRSPANNGDSLEQAAYSGGGRASFRSIWQNFPLVAGGVLVAILTIVVLFGPQLSPHSPYATQGLELIDGEIVVPPFEPNANFPWGTDVLGRDMMSLILSGAQLTLTLALAVVITRIALGIFLGMVAGWKNGSTLDRLIVGSAEVLAAIPTLLLAMVLILALGIRQGMWPFIVGLGFIGWGETMQFVRGEVTSVRPKSFIESAIAIGARTPRIITRHILPILNSSLISIFALEMGAVLMLLGELGFLSIFIGGGAFQELETFAAPYHYSDVPEWGALLSNIRTYSRAYPWLTLYPTLAFFIAILAFNLFGEGIRRLVDSGSLVINRLFNRYTVMAGVLVAIGLVWLRSNSGAQAFYGQQAGEFDGQRSYGYVAELTKPNFESRALGTEGLEKAAHYIAAEFEALGLQPAGQHQTYLQERFRSFSRLESIPEFTIQDGGSEPKYGIDFAAYPGYYLSHGEISGPVRYIGLSDSMPGTGFGGFFDHPGLRYADFEGEVLLVVDPSEVRSLRRVPNGGILIVTDDPELLGRRITLSNRSLAEPSPITGRVTGQDTPALWITENVANRLLAKSGKTVEELREEQVFLEIGTATKIDTGVNVSMAAQSSTEERWPAYNAIGHLPGTSSIGSREEKLDHELILVLAQYDSPPPGPEDVPYPAANDNASGVAVMLEAIRVMQETEYAPKRTFLFVAYSGEGLEGGNDVSNPDINIFLQAKAGFARNLEPEAIVHVRGVGGGTGDRLEVSAGGSLRLAELFETAGKRMGARVTRGKDPIDISVIYEEGSPYDSASEAPEVRLTWEGWEENARRPADTLDNISVENLTDAGRTLALALMILGGERQY
jgi:ABC-type dipeptide/oligopeptide/nickel transport system permease component